MSDTVRAAWADLDVRAEANAKELIENRQPAICFICAKVGREEVLTHRYCANCYRGFCTSKHHGNFAHNRGMCLYCGIPKEDRSKIRGLVRDRAKAAKALIQCHFDDATIASVLSVAPFPITVLRDLMENVGKSSSHQ